YRKPAVAVLFCLCALTRAGGRVPRPHWHFDLVFRRGAPSSLSGSLRALSGSTATYHQHTVMLCHKIHLSPVVKASHCRRDMAEADSRLRAQQAALPGPLPPLRVTLFEIVLSILRSGASVHSNPGDHADMPQRTRTPDSEYYAGHSRACTVPPQYADRAYSEIKQMAINYTLKPTEQINIEELAHKLNMSVTPVREALNRLLNEDILVRRGSRGFCNRPIDLTELKEL